jgi:glutathione S-transferase
MSRLSAKCRRAAKRKKGEDNVVLELYHNTNSVCAQKVRIALNDKGQVAKDHILTLRGDQNDPAHMKLNQNGVVPTLLHDGRRIVESPLILHYIDDTLFDRMGQADWAPFTNLVPDP